MKRIGCILVALFVLLGLCGCQSEEPSDITVITKGSVSHSLQTTTTTTATTTTTTAGLAPNQTTGSGGSTASTTLPTIATDGDTTEVGNTIAQTAISLIGTPFESNAGGPDAFDNPGFVAYCYKQAGFSVPRRASAMASFGKEASLDALQPGDLLLFCNDIGGEAQFVGIYIGDDQFVACNNPGSLTKAQKIDNKYWLPRLLAARRAPAE